MFDIYDVANVVSVIELVVVYFRVSLRFTKLINHVQQKTFQVQTMAINITANSCFLFYSLVNAQYPIMLNCLSVITLEGSLIYMKNFGD